MNRYLPAELVTPHDLRLGLAESKSNLAKHQSSFRFIYDVDDLHYYYTERLSTLFITHNRESDTFVLHIHVKAPITTSETALNAFQVITIQVPTHSNDSQPGTGYTTVANLHDYFLVSTSRNSYAELSSQTYAYCTSLQDNVCPALALNKDKHDLSCLAAIFFNEHSTIQRKCTFQYFPKAPAPTYAIYVREGTYIIATRTAELHFICPQFAKRTHYTYFAQVQVPCNCIVSSDNLYIPPSIANCDLPSTTVHISHPLNLAQFAMAGFDVDRITADQPQFRLQPPQIYTPEFSNLGDTTGLRHEDEMLQLDLANQQVGVQTQKVRIDEIKPIATTTSNLDDLIAHCVSFGLISVLSVGIIAIGVKTYRHNIILLTLLHPTEAYVFTKPPPTVFTDPTPVASTVSLSDIVILFIAAIVVVTCFQLIRYALKKLISDKLRTFTITEATLYLVITDVNTSHVEQITTVYECVKHIHLQAMPPILDISYATHFFSKPTVSFQWAHPIAVEAFGLVREVPLPTSFKVPLSLAKLLYGSSKSTRDIRNYPVVAVTLRVQCGCGCRTSKAASALIQNTNRPRQTQTSDTTSTSRDYPTSSASTASSRPSRLELSSA